MPIGCRPLTSDQADAIARVPNEIHGEWDDDTEIALTTTPQLISEWVASELSTAVGVSQSEGTFTTSTYAGVMVTIKRSYRNGDTNPSVAVNATIELYVNGESEFTNTAVIPPATNPGGDGVTSITTPFQVEVSDGDEFQIYVSASDDSADPEDASLTDIRVSVIPVYATSE